MDDQTRKTAWSDPAAGNREAKLQELANLRRRVADLEAELDRDQSANGGWTHKYYTGYYATAGFMLGMIGALASLMFNIVGSLMWQRLGGHAQHPLRLIQVYLTFPLGAAALQIDNGMTLAVGCCLYLATGMVYGVLFHLVLTRLTANARFVDRFVVVSILALAVWLVNFYGILSWLQPLLLGGNWIVELVPWWVAALTHLVFGWTMLLVYPWGLYVPYRPARMEAR
jgi:hypothetical protein